ncbi:response regulator [Curtobacterium ammoniigenes]|uniref:response regulator n=1 Tax=Curtobacterium ammoniigenes TaxID=395387 RepID=UPI00082ED624
MTLRVFLVEDHELVRQGVARVIDAQPDLEVVGEAESIARAVPRIAATQPDIAVLDVRLPDGSGIDLCRTVRSEHPDMPCLMLTAYDDDEATRSAVLAGASGYVLKDIRGNTLVEAIRKAATGATLFSPDLLQRVRASLVAEVGAGGLGGGGAGRGGVGTGRAAPGSPGASSGSGTGTGRGGAGTGRAAPGSSGTSSASGTGAGAGGLNTADTDRRSSTRQEHTGTEPNEHASSTSHQARPANEPGSGRSVWNDPDQLTPRERQILDLIVDGLTNRQIGERLHIAEKTVKNNVSVVLSKLHVERRTQAAVYRLRQGDGR